ncbi:hypothetical protein PV325_009680, partial [Microctonus aethiopoides]
MEGSRLQKLEKLRDLTQPYVEIAAELGIVEDPTARSLVMEVLKDKVKKSEEQPLRVAEVPRPRLRPPLRSDATPKTISVAHIQRTPQRPMFKPLPYLWREESEVVTRELINILERNPNYPREPRYGCFNCSDPSHSAKECPWSRDTWCGQCGEVGMVHTNCPRCYPEQYGLKNKPFTTENILDDNGLRSNHENVFDDEGHEEQAENPKRKHCTRLKKSRASVYEDQLSIATVVWLTSGPHPGKYEAVIPRSQGIFGIDKVLRIVNDYFAFSDWRFQENLNWFRKTCDAAADVCPLLGCRAKIFCGTIGSRKEPGAQHIYLSCRLFEIFQERTK